MSTTTTPTVEPRTYCRADGTVETRWVQARDGTHVLTASGQPIDVTSGAAAAARRQQRQAGAVAARAEAIVARVQDVEAARIAAREREQAAERMRLRRVANEAIAQHLAAKRDGHQPPPPPDEAGNRPGRLVWRARHDDALDAERRYFPPPFAQ